MAFRPEPVRIGDTFRVGSPFQVADFTPTATHGIGVKRVDPAATADGTPFSFQMDQTTVLPLMVFPEVSQATSVAVLESMVHRPTDDKIYGAVGNALNSYAKAGLGSAAAIATLPYTNNWFGLVFVAGLAGNPDLFYAINDNANELYSIDPNGGVVTLVAALSTATRVGMAYDRTTNTTWVLHSTGDIYQMDLTSGVEALLGASGIPTPEALTWDTKRRRLYATGTDSGTHKAYEINIGSGIATELGSLTTSASPKVLAYDSVGDYLYYVDTGDEYWRFAFNASTAKWDLGGYDAVYYIDGNAHFTNVGGVPVFEFNATTLPVEDDYFVVGIFEVVGGNPADLLDFSVVYRQKVNLDIRDTTTVGVDLGLLEDALAMAGHNVKYRELERSTGQPSSSEIAVFNRDLVDLSVQEDDLDDNTGLRKRVNLRHDIDNFGDTIGYRGW